MLKALVFDSGYGGELLADRLEEEIPVIEIVRIIDWHHANQYLTNPRIARKLAESALAPHLGKVDLVIFANHLLSLTSLKYFRRKYPNQKFLGLELKAPDSFIKRDIVILATRAVRKTMGYHGFIFSLKRRTKTLTLDTWPDKIDDGELTLAEIEETLHGSIVCGKGHPQEIILACAQFEDIIPDLKRLYGKHLKIYSSFDGTIREACKILHIRGGVGKQK